jgi:hypothetical protein
MMLKADGLDEAILGELDVTRDDVIVPVLAYSVERIIAILMERDGMDEEEAFEFFQFNIEQAYVGQTTPVYIYPHLE